NRRESHRYIASIIFQSRSEILDAAAALHAAAQRRAFTSRRDASLSRRRVHRPRSGIWDAARGAVSGLPALEPESNDPGDAMMDAGLVPPLDAPVSTR